MSQAMNTLEWAVVLRSVERFGDMGRDPTTDEVAESAALQGVLQIAPPGSLYSRRNRTYTLLSRLARDQMVSRVPRKEERVMRWALTAVGKDTCDRLRDVFSILESRCDSPKASTPQKEAT